MCSAPATAPSALYATPRLLLTGGPRARAPLSPFQEPLKCRLKSCSMSHVEKGAEPGSKPRFGLLQSCCILQIISPQSHQRERRKTGPNPKPFGSWPTSLGQQEDSRDPPAGRKQGLLALAVTPTRPGPMPSMAPLSAFLRPQGGEPMGSRRGTGLGEMCTGTRGVPAPVLPAAEPLQPGGHPPHRCQGQALGTGTQALQGMAGCPLPTAPWWW